MRRAKPTRSQPRYQPGDKIGGRYQVHQALMGGMGEVYLCLDLETIQPYALKTFQQRYLTNPRLWTAFETEVVTWVALEKHPNIVRCFYMEIFDNQPFMFLEWIAGEEDRGTDMRSWLRHGSLDLRLALDFTIDICRGLIHAQEKQPGIVHRDLKPENILIAEGRLAKIVRDAELEITGAERETDRRQSLLGQGGIVGTPPYMAPEQWRNEELDRRTDIYAVGCILYEMLTGSWPFQATTFHGLRRQHLEANIPKLADDQIWPDSLNTFLPRCLAKRREERFTTVSDLLQLLILIYEQRFVESPKTAVILGGDELTATDYNNRGVTYHTLQRYDEALADCSRAIQLDPSVNAYINRGSIYHSLQQYNEALADFDRAIQLDPTDPKAYNNRGITYADLQRYAEALADYQQAIDLDPALAQTYSNRGFVYESLQHFDKALADYNKAIQLDKNLAQAYVNRCAIHGAMGRSAEALSDADHAIHLDPANSKAYMNRALAYMQLSRFDDAFADFAKAIEFDPSDSEVYYNRAKLYEILQQFNEALSDYSRAIQINPSYGWAVNCRGRVYSILNRFGEALNDFSRAIEIDPKHVLAYFNRGTLYLRLDQPDKAISDFTSAIRIEPTNAEAYTNRGAAYSQMERFDEALSDFKKGIELDPANALAHRNIGVLNYKRGMRQEALHHFEKAAELGDVEAEEYIAQLKKETGLASASQDNLAQIIHRLKTDKKFCDLFRSEPVRAVAEYHLTIGEALELLASKDLPSGTMQDLQARLKLLQFIASYGDKE